MKSPKSPDYAPYLAAIPMPETIKALPVCPVRKVPVPWFVTWIDGKPEFRIADGKKMTLALSAKLCWVCGQRIKSPPYSFVTGPMCTVTRTSAEPPCHLECAVFSVRACPFLSKPHMDRREGGIPEEIENRAGCAGVMIRRNPGVSCCWVTEKYTPFQDTHGGGGILIEMGPPLKTMVTWWAEGRRATRAEVERSADTGLPALMEMAVAESPAAVAQLNAMYERAKAFFPAAV
jgi:hypothetical protein